MTETTFWIDENVSNAVPISSATIIMVVTKGGFLRSIQKRSSAWINPRLICRICDSRPPAFASLHIIEYNIGVLEGRKRTGLAL